SCLTRAEQEPNHEECAEPPSRAGERRKERPADHDPRKDPPRAIPVAPPTGWNLEDRVGERECSENEPKLGAGDPQFLLDDRRCLIDASAVKVKDEGHRRKKRQNTVTDPCRALTQVSGQ